MRLDDVRETTTTSTSTSTPSSPVTRALAHAEDALLLDAHDDAIAHYYDALATRPHAPPLTPALLQRALLGRADAWLRKSIHDRNDLAFSNALADARRVISLYPSEDNGWLLLARVYTAHGNTERAVHILNRARSHCDNVDRIEDVLSDLTTASQLRNMQTSPVNHDIQDDWDDPGTMPAEPVAYGHPTGSNFHTQELRDQMDAFPPEGVYPDSGQAADRQQTVPQSDRSYGPLSARTQLDRQQTGRHTSQRDILSQTLTAQMQRPLTPVTTYYRNHSTLSQDSSSAMSMDEGQNTFFNNLTDAQRKEAQWKEAVRRERRRRERALRSDHLQVRQQEAERVSALRQSQGDDVASRVGYLQQQGNPPHGPTVSAPIPISAQMPTARSAVLPPPPPPPVQTEVRSRSQPVFMPRAGLPPRVKASSSLRECATSQTAAMEEESGRTRTSTKSSFERSDRSFGTSPTKLYELLQVPRDATEGQIKKSYYLLARKYHPDKNADDAQATEQFQNLAEAYRVLSDPESRAVYDRYGDRGLVKNSVDVIDPSTLFAMVFGSDQFVHLIGELQLASLATNVDDGGNTPTEDILNDIQRARVGKLVLEMVKKLKRWVDGDKKGFIGDVHQQMKELREASFGPSLLHTVGNMYVQQTTYLLDKTRPFNLSAVMRKATIRSHKIAAQHKAMTAASKVMDKQRKLHDRVMRTGRDSRFISEEEAKSIAVEMAENAIDMMWKISVIDIETTLEDVLMIVLCGRDLVAEGESFTSLDTLFDSFAGVEKSTRHRRRIGSHLGRDRRDRGGDRGKDGDRGDFGLVRPLAALPHGEGAHTRQEILSERAYGIQAMGRVFMSAGR